MYILNDMYVNCLNIKIPKINKYEHEQFSTTWVVGGGSKIQLQ